MCSIAPPISSPTERPFYTGWWTSFANPEKLAGYADDGHSLVLATGAGWSSAPDQRVHIKAYLDEAHKHGIKVILSLTKERHTPYGISAEEFVDTISAVKDHPALFAWYLSDEPELYDAGDGYRTDDWLITYNYLASDPGYYPLARSADPTHPVLISFAMLHRPEEPSFPILNFLEVTDLIGMHSYPFWPVDSEFASYDSRNQYDKWKYLLDKVDLHDKTGLIATAQALDEEVGYRTPTYREISHQIFSAVVLGVNKILFFHEDYASAQMKDLVKRMIHKLQMIGAEMENGVTNDPRVGVSIIDRNRLVYRYGVSDNRHVILAVNIADRETASGATLEAVRFSLPSGVKASQISVLGEDRSIMVADNVFTDTLLPFSVRIYTFTSGTLR